MPRCSEAATSGLGIQRLPANLLAIHKKLKRAFDPEGILGPAASMPISNHVQRKRRYAKEMQRNAMRTGGYGFG